MSISTLSRNLVGLFLTLLFAAPLAMADDHAKGGARANMIVLEAVITDINLDTRQVSIQGPLGDTVTLTASEQVVSLDDLKVGDSIVATYLSALEGEVREPTEEELAEPWLVLEDGGALPEDAPPGIGGARIIRAVCTIEGMNRLLGTVVIKDPRGMVHVIEDVEPEKMAGVTLGQTIVLVYTEALALSLELAPGSSEGGS